MNNIISILNINSVEFQNTEMVLVKVVIIFYSLLKAEVRRIYKFYCRKLGYSQAF